MSTRPSSICDHGWARWLCSECPPVTSPDGATSVPHVDAATSAGGDGSARGHLADPSPRLYEVRRIAAWVPVSMEVLRSLDPEPVHAEGGRCLLMAVAYGARPPVNNGRERRP
jgi:hypothetical protein